MYKKLLYSFLAFSVLIIHLGCKDDTQTVDNTNTQQGDALWEISGNNHRILDQYGNSVQINGDAAWSLIAQVSYVDAKAYIDDRASKGINALLVSLIEHYYTDNSPAWRNTAGDLPFNSEISTNNPDFNDTNSSYWSHADSVIKYAASKGITIFAFPAYVGYRHNYSGWANVMIANGASKLTTYGEWIGKRYRDFPNIVWVMGGDWGPTHNDTDITDEVNAIANGIKNEDTNHLITAHSSRGRSALDDYNQPWLDFNSSYSTETEITNRVEYDYGRSKYLPTLLIEARYGNTSDQTMTPKQVVREMYQAILHGAIGHFTGTHGVWSFSASSAHDFSSDDSNWKFILNKYGAQYLKYVVRLQAARNLPDLSPDSSDTFVTSEKGTGQSESVFVVNSTQLVGLHVEGLPHTYDLSQFSGPVIVRWFDPITGNTTTDTGSPYDNSSSTQVLNPPNMNHDWISLVDMASLGLNSP